MEHFPDLFPKSFLLFRCRCGDLEICAPRGFGVIGSVKQEYFIGRFIPDMLKVFQPVGQGLALKPFGQTEKIVAADTGIHICPVVREKSAGDVGVVASGIVGCETVAEKEKMFRFGTETVLAHFCSQLRSGGGDKKRVSGILFFADTYKTHAFAAGGPEKHLVFA